MSIQSILDDDALALVPLIKEAMDNVDDFDSNQIRCSTLSSMMNLPVPVADMNEEQLSEFQHNSISYFKHMGWLE